MFAGGVFPEKPEKFQKKPLNCIYFIDVSD